MTLAVKNLVIFEGSLKIKVDSFESLSPHEKTGAVWDDLDDEALNNVKSHIKQHYIFEQDYTCPYCRQRIEVNHKSIWDIDHIIPKSLRPDFLFKPLNLCVSCKDCNQYKSSKNVLINKKRKTLPVKSADYKVVHPNLDVYENHIKIIETPLFYIPLDIKGKETIEVCGLLRFLFKLTDYGSTPVEFAKNIFKLVEKFATVSDPVESYYYLSLIEDMAKEGKALSRKRHIEPGSTG